MKKIISSLFLFIVLFLVLNFFKNDIANLYILINKKVSVKMSRGDAQNTSEIDSLKNENERLRTLISEASSTQVFANQGILDIIIAHGSFFDKVSIIYSEFILDKGFSSDIKEGSLVYIAGLHPVGVITETQKDYSRLKLFTSYKNTIDVTKSDTENSSFSLIGDGSYGFSARVLDSFDIKSGDSLYLKSYPTLKVAEVIEVKDIENENEKIVYARSFFNKSSPLVFYIQK